MTGIPHFDLPFRFTVGGHARVVEQDSLEDVSNCVEAILLTVQGDRPEIPSFGIHDPTFGRQPLDFSSTIEAITDHEPRAAVVFEQQPDLVDVLINRTTVRVSNAQGITTPEEVTSV